MLIKFIGTGKGSARHALDYLFREKDSKKNERAGIELLRGNPEIVTAITDSLDFKHKYRSAVIAWHKQDNPSEQDIDEVLDEFERVAFAGLESNQYCYYAVLHTEQDGSKHIHIITPRVELQSGKSFNIAPPNWQKTYDLIRDKFNLKNDWKSPKDHNRKLSNTHLKPHQLKNNHTLAKTQIKQSIANLIEKNVIKNEDDVMKYLGELGEVKRRGRAISLSIKGMKKNIRLDPRKDGIAYGTGFDITKTLDEFKQERERKNSQSREDRERVLQQIEREIENAIRARSSYARERYRRDDNQVETISKQKSTGIQNNARASIASSRIIEQIPSEKYNRDEELANWRDNNDEQDAQAIISDINTIDNSTINRDRLGDITEKDDDDKRKNRNHGDIVDKRQIYDRDEGWKNNLDTENGEINDRIRNEINKRIEIARRDVYKRARKSNTNVRKKYEQSYVGIGKAKRNMERNSEGTIEHIEELQRYRIERKREIRANAIGEFRAFFDRKIGEIRESKIGAKIGEIGAKIGGILSQIGLKIELKIELKKLKKVRDYKLEIEQKKSKKRTYKYDENDYTNMRNM